MQERYVTGCMAWGMQYLKATGHVDDIAIGEFSGDLDGCKTTTGEPIDQCAKSPCGISRC